MHSPLAVVEGSYWKDILEQPAALRRTLEALQRQQMPATLAEYRFHKGVDRVVLTGMGSSLHALHPLNIRLNQAGWASQMIETSELIGYYGEVLTPSTLTVVVSQSGETAEVVRLFADGPLPGPTLGVTNTAGSTLDRACGLSLVTAAGVEATVSCKTYIAGLAALHWLGDALLGAGPQPAEEGFLFAGRQIESYLGEWQEHVDWFAERLLGIRRVFVVGRGWSMATAGTGGLILKESTRIAAEGLSAAAFRHGPMESLSSEVLVCLCEGDARTRELNRRLYQDVLAAGGRAFWLSADSRDRALRVRAAAPELLPLTEILPVQMVSLAIAALRGEEAGRFQLATKVTAVE